MLSKVTSAVVHGVDALSVIVETDISAGLPSLNIVGLADITVKEAKERVRSAIVNSGIKYPRGRITINMAPATLKKKGSHFDLAMAVGIMVSSGQLCDDDIEKCGFLGELSLGGSINKCDGILPMVMTMRNEGIENFFLPMANCTEAALVKGINIFPVKNLRALIKHFNINEKIAMYRLENEKTEKDEYTSAQDFLDVKGQEFAKRAITVAVAGGHCILMTGSPSTGKTMMAERIPGIMPEMTFDEIVGATITYSVSGLLNEEMPYVKKRPFRRPHHKITSVGLLGGGAYPRPGEISLASKGVLFLDEVGEFEKNLIDTLRLPLEQKQISIIRKGETYILPADFMLVAASNPCKCGYYGDSTHECICTKGDLERYRSKISGPILDRIDMHIRLQAVAYKDFKDETSKSSSEMRSEIEKAREIQNTRYKDMGISLNHQLDEHSVNQFCQLDSRGNVFIENAYDKLKLNPRTLLKTKKVARTIADLEGENMISEYHIAEAIQYREISL